MLIAETGDPRAQFVKSFSRVRRHSPAANEYVWVEVYWATADRAVIDAQGE